MSFWRPGESRPPGSDITFDRNTEKEGGNRIVYNPNSYLDLQEQRKRLPIYKQRREILYLLEHHNTLIIEGSTGSGKTTQIPQYLLESGWCENGFKIGITQPRRVSCVSIAQRVAQELKCDVGETVGYAIQHDIRTNKQTKIKYLTDGMLLREMMSDSLLSTYSVIMIDEAHERTMSTDIVLGLLSRLCQVRTDLKIIISSATLQSSLFQKHFKAAYLLTIQGRQHAIETHYLKQPCKNYMEKMIETIEEIHMHCPQGDILCFLPGQREIHYIIEQLSAGSSSTLITIPLYANLPRKSQMNVFKRVDKSCRKVIVSTNIAEASITIPGIRYVVDSGFVREKYMISGKDMLRQVMISKASARQRAGRAGRTQDGHVYRLYTKDAFSKMMAFSVPEIQRSSLVSPLLQLKALGVHDILRFSFISPPSLSILKTSLEILYALEAIDKMGELTQPIGFQMAEMPLEPQLARAVLKSAQMNCTSEMVTLAALLTTKDVFTRHAKAPLAMKKFAVMEGDPLMLLNVYHTYLRERSHSRASQWCTDHFLIERVLKRVSLLRASLKQHLSSLNMKMASSSEPVSLLQCLLGGFFENAAVRQDDNSYRLVAFPKSEPYFIHPTSCLFQFPPPYVAFCDLLETDKIYMRDVFTIEPEWLAKMAPHYYAYRESEKFIHHTS
mmetsp:Transcript_6994/g.10258  ORF Transcript_6994/g.10258 Transcript_6994/m.10258 type:complete len:670 (+) Transcript_6994:63-2072(+)